MKIPRKLVLKAIRKSNKEQSDFMNKQKKPIKKDAYDWREGVCKSCGVEAKSGCCDIHSMKCSMCRGWGAISKRIWEYVYKKNEKERSNPFNKCCEKCSAYFAHGVGSHSDTRDEEPCYCNKNTCDWVYCECHIT